MLFTHFHRRSLRDTPVFSALINGEGEVVDFLRLPYFTKRRNAFREDEREKKVQTRQQQQLRVNPSGGHSQMFPLRPKTLKTSSVF